MKVAVFSEAEADEAGITVLVGGVLGVEVEPVTLLSRPGNGWPFVLQFLPTVVQQLYYGTDAEALVTVVDSDDSPVHHFDHEQAGQRDTSCRLCVLRRRIAEVKASLNPMAGREMLKTAVGLAVPSIEAWFQCMSDTHVNEVTWENKLRGVRINYTKESLKLAAYGSDRAPMRHKIDIARQSAARLVVDLDMFEALFPGGFGSFARELRSWQLQ